MINKIDTTKCQFIVPFSKPIIDIPILKTRTHCHYFTY